MHAGVDRRVLLGQAMLALGARSIEPLDPGSAIVPGDLPDRASRRRRGNGSDHGKAASYGPRHPGPFAKIIRFSSSVLHAGAWRADVPITTIITCNIEIDATVFKSAQDGRTAERTQSGPKSDRCPCQRSAFSRRAAQAVVIATSSDSTPQKNTIDLQWKMRPVCNASSCEDERKGVGARAMGSNGKTMRRTMESNEKYKGRGYVRL
jgi:hypothetical protein